MRLKGKVPFMTSVTHEFDDRLARRNAILLAAAVALAGANSIVIFATGAIVGSGLAPDRSLATLPISVFVIGMAMGTLPIGWIARQFGRRVAFATGAGSGVITGILSCIAVVIGSFPLFCVSTFFGGIYGAAAQSYRFAAADTASPAFRPKAISWVMAGGVFGGVLGPELLTHTMNLWQPYVFAASYIAQAVVALVSIALLLQVKAAPPVANANADARPLSEIVKQNRFIAAVICGIVSYGLMNFVMTSAPLAMKLCGHDIADSNRGIEWHVIAMYLPSFITGGLIARFGAPSVILAGLALIVGAGVVDLMGTTVAHFWTGLILIGVGWNFGFIGASALVTETHRPSERAKVQSFNDFLVFGTMVLGSFSSGHILTDYGWNTVNMLVFPPVAAGVLALLWYSWTRRRPAIG
jgi:MFS family permease